MLNGIVFLVGCAIYIAAFVVVRFLVARRFGVRDVKAAFGIRHAPWNVVSFWRRALFTIAGPVACFLAAVVFLAMGQLLHGRDLVDESSMRIVVAPSGPAAAASFADGDRIETVGGVAVASWDALRTEISAHAGTPVEITLERSGRRLTLSPTPGPTGRIGITAPVEHQAVGVGSAIAFGFREPLRIWGAQLELMIAPPKKVEGVGPVGLVRIATQAPDTAGTALAVAGLAMAGYLWAPILFALASFPRRGRKAS